MPTELGQLLRLVLLMGLIKAACAHNCSAMATINCPIVNAYVTKVTDPLTKKEHSIVIMKLGAKIPKMEYDAVSKVASEVEVDELQFSFRAFVAQLIACRPEVSELYQTVQFTKDADKPRMLTIFVRLMTRDAVYDIDAVQHTAGEKFENGTIARFDSYIYNISAVKFADELEIKLQPKSIDDDIAAFGL